MSPYGHNDHIGPARPKWSILSPVRDERRSNCVVLSASVLDNLDRSASPRATVVMPQAAPAGKLAHAGGLSDMGLSASSELGAWLEPDRYGTSCHGGVARASHYLTLGFAFHINLVLNLALDHADGVGALSFQHDGLSSQGLC